MSRIAVVMSLLVALLCLPLAGQARGAPVPGEQAMVKQLPKAVLSGTLEEAIDQIRKLSGAQIIVSWRSLTTAGVRRATKVSATVQKVSIGQLLDKVLALAAGQGQPLGWFVDDDVVYVTTQRIVLNRRMGIASGKPTGAMALPVAAATAPDGGGLNLQDVPLEDALTYIQQRTGLNMHVNWRALALASVDKKTAISLQVRNITVARTLDLLCDQLSGGQARESAIYWYNEQGVLTITTGSALDTDLTAKVIDVSDLLAIVPNFKGPRIELSNIGNQNTNGTGSGSGSGDGGFFDDNSNKGGGDYDKQRHEEDPVEMRKKIRETLKSIIVESIGMEMWREGGGKGNVRFLGNRMIISQTRLGFLLMAKAGVLH